jgi:phosphoesterase RecJ-like protein
MNQIVEHLKAGERILLATHTQPDGDALGSLLAMGLALKRWKKSVTLYSESPIPAVYRFLPGIHLVAKNVQISGHDTAVVVDCGDIRRVGIRAGDINRISMVINLDHHVTNTKFGDLRIVDTKACATAEIIHRIIKKMEIPIGVDIATAIYTGILTDTGFFRFSNTNLAAFSICRDMVEKGVDPHTVSQNVYGKYSLGRIKLLNLALDSIEISKNGGMSIMTLTRNMLKETETQPEDLDGMINYARRIEDVKLAVLIHEVKACGNNGRSEFHVSLRSDGSVDVAALAASFGGGGHFSAAGFNIETSLADLKLKLYEISETVGSRCIEN